jgi:hypothetical protein
VVRLGEIVMILDLHRQGACARTASRIESGSDEHLPRQIIAPSTSITQTEVVASETSRPT